MRKVHLGTIGWSYSFWKNIFYPSKSVAKDFLAYYASQFDTVEVDSTFYRNPTRQTVTNWKQQTPDDFIFSLKFPQVITHIKKLKDCQKETDLFLKTAELLGEKLGPLLMQFPPNFSAQHLADLEAYLQNLPRVHRYVVEVRNKTWLNHDFYARLEAYRVALAWTDRPLMQQTEAVTSDFLYVRWEGDRKAVKGTLGRIEVDRQADLKALAEKVRLFSMRDMEFFGYFGKYYSGYPPTDVRRLQQYLDASTSKS